MTPWPRFRRFVGDNAKQVKNATLVPADSRNSTAAVSCDPSPIYACSRVPDGLSSNTHCGDPSDRIGVHIHGTLAIHISASRCLDQRGPKSLPIEFGSAELGRK